MGALIPSPSDQEIVAKLNWLFSESQITTLVQHQVLHHEQLFDPQHHLHRVAYRIGAHPHGPTRGRWFFFLHWILPNAHHDGMQTIDAIKAVLDAALNPDNHVNSVVFQVTQDSTATDYYLYPANNAQPVQHNLPHSGQVIYSLTLVCPRSIPPGVTDPDPLAGDPHEHPLPW